jgi:hypothetical protein
VLVDLLSLYQSTKTKEGKLDNKSSYQPKGGIAMISNWVQLAILDLQKKRCSCTSYEPGKCEKCDILEELIKLRIRIDELMR